MAVIMDACGQITLVTATRPPSLRAISSSSCLSMLFSSMSTFRGVTFFYQDRCISMLLVIIIMFTSTTLLGLLGLSLSSLLLPRLWSCSTFCTIHNSHPYSPIRSHCIEMSVLTIVTTVLFCIEISVVIIVTTEPHHTCSAKLLSSCLPCSNASTAASSSRRSFSTWKDDKLTTINGF